MKKTKGQLLQDIESLSIDPIWGCMTRAAMSLRWDEVTDSAVAVVYCDIDRMHDLNSHYGHAEVDNRIKGVIAKVRHGDKSRKSDIVVSRWLNGDELVFLLKSGSPQQFCERIQADFQAVGISVTMAHSPIITPSPTDTINPLDEQVTQYKNVDMRGEIIALYK